jgi:Ca2+-binding EF-hand superfamily protein
MNSIDLNAAGKSATTPQVFATLDPNRKGYLSTADVASNKFLTDNFKRCDSNSDGRLSQSEVSVCMGH